MRDTSLYIPLMVCFLSCVQASATVHPVAAKAVPHAHASAVVSAHTKKASVAAKDVRVASAGRSSVAHVVAGKSKAGLKQSELEKARASREKPENAARLKTAPAAKAQVPAEQAEPAEDTVYVTHDRKVHHSAEEEPRKATPSDFMPDPVAKDDAEEVPKPDAPVKAAASRTAKEAATAKENRVAPHSTQDDGLKQAPVPVLFTKGGRLIVPPALKGSHEILVRQNEMADREGLSRVQDDVDLDNMRESRQLVAIPKVQGMETDERLPENRRYCRPWTAQFLTALAKAHYQQFHRALQVNSAVRTVEVQQRLLRTNGNAAPVEGETASPHLTGQAVDLAKKGLSITEIAWLRGYLLPLVQQGKVDVEEEFQQSCFHISVYKKYLPSPAPRREIASSGHSAVTAMATAVR